MDAATCQACLGERSVVSHDGLPAHLRAYFFRPFSPILSSYDLAVAVQKQYHPGDLIVIDGEYHQASTLNFYTHIPVRVLHPPSGNLWYGEKFPDAPHVFETPQSFADLWSGPARVFLWTDQEDPKELLGMPPSSCPQRREVNFHEPQAANDLNPRCLS